jgi:hypothetical protein
MLKINTDFSFIHQEQFIKPEEVYALKKKFEYIKSNNFYSSPSDNVIHLTRKETYMEPAFEKLSKKIELFFAKNIGLTNLKLDKLGLYTSLNKNTNSSILPYIPHFDKHRCFKAMVYLHDVTEKHGPIHFGHTRDDADIEFRRKKLPHDYKILGLNTVNQEDIINKMIPMVGLAGDVVFFDTNVPHKAGMVSNGYERYVLRFDFDLDGLNVKPSIIDRLLKKFYMLCNINQKSR